MDFLEFFFLSCLRRLPCLESFLASCFESYYLKCGPKNIFKKSLFSSYSYKLLLKSFTLNFSFFISFCFVSKFSSSDYNFIDKNYKL